VEDESAKCHQACAFIKGYIIWARKQHRWDAETFIMVKEAIGIVGEPRLGRRPNLDRRFVMKEMFD